MELDRSDACVLKWIQDYDEKCRASRTVIFNGFYRYLQNHPTLKELTPSQLIEFQDKTDNKEATKADRVMILEALQEYIRGRQGTYNSLKTQYSTVKAFFVANRSELPRDKFRIKPSRERIDDLLDPHIVKDLISVADFGIKAFYLTLYQGFLDQERFHIFNLSGAYELANHIKEKGITEPFKISFSGRKGNKNKIPFYTFIGYDALQAWQQYFERVRGWPKQGEALLLDRNGNPFTKDSLQAHHRRLLTKLGYIKREKNILARYGFGMHNFRDAAVTSVSPHKNEGYEKDTYEFFLGHITDPNGYDKFYREEADVKRKYRIMLPYLNLISEGKAEIGEQVKEHAEQMQKQASAIKQLEKKLNEAEIAWKNPNRYVVGYAEFIAVHRLAQKEGWSPEETARLEKVASATWSQEYEKIRHKLEPELERARIDFKRGEEAGPEGIDQLFSDSDPIKVFLKSAFAKFPDWDNFFEWSYGRKRKKLSKTVA